jgi:hypothetical protein
VKRYKESTGVRANAGQIALLASARIASRAVGTTEVPFELATLRLYGLPEHAPALLSGRPAPPVGTREFQAEASLDLPSLAPGATHLVATSPR